MVRVLVVLLWMSCGGDSAPADDPAGGASAIAADTGKVRELTGKVTATRGGATRTLAVGNPVSADDVIDTGTDGSVVIELAHNNALWSLEAGIKARVDQSVAWGLPKQEAAKPIDHATSSAGRHADREAANTAVSAADGANEPKGDVEAATAPKTAPTPSVTTPPPPPPRPTGEPKPRDTARPPSGGGGGGDCDDVSCMLSDYAAACCAKFKKSGGGGSTAPTTGAGLPESPAPQNVRSGMSQLKPAILACGKPVDAKGMLKIQIKIAPAGTVTSVEVQESPNPAIDACVIATVKKHAFARSQKGVTVTYPIRF